MIAVKISKNFDTKIDIAIKYYMILSVLNNLKLSELDIQLISFIAVRDNISVGGGKEEFCRIFDSTRASIYAGVYRLTKRGFIVKEEKKAKLNPAFVMDFSDDLIIQIRMNEINKKDNLISRISEDLEMNQADLEKIIAFQGEDALSSVRVVKEIEFSGFGKFLINKNKVKNKIKVKERTIQGLVTSGKNDVAEAIKPELEYYKSKL